MATPMEMMQNEIHGLRQQLGNLEVNVIPAMSQQLAQAITAIETNVINMEELRQNNLLNMARSLDNAKTAVDAFAAGEGKKWTEAHDSYRSTSRTRNLNSPL